MKKKNQRSISQRLDRAPSTAEKKQIFLDWTESWRMEQTQLIHRLGKAVSDHNQTELCIVVGELRAMSVKKFDALLKIQSNHSPFESVTEIDTIVDLDSQIVN